MEEKLRLMIVDDNPRARGALTALNSTLDCVSETFGCGSTMAMDLCRAHGKDPDEAVAGTVGPDPQ